MTLEEFTHITLQVLQEGGGMATYAPTLVVDGVIQVIEGIPEEMDHREAIQSVIRRCGLEGSEFLFALRTGEGEVTTGHQTASGAQFLRIVELRQGYVLAEPKDCSWWRIGSGDGDPQA